MSEVRTNHLLESVKKDFDLLLAKLSELASEVRPRTRLSSTKLGRLKKNLDNWQGLKKEDIAKTFEVAIKYNSINGIFSEHVHYKKSDLFKIIEGSLNSETESDETYNDFFFEFSMATRFLRASQREAKVVSINLEGDCDIIVNESIAVECKYIHSQAAIVSNVSKANSQISKRVAKGQAKFGFIALDFSNLIPREKINTFIQFTLSNFLETYEKLETNKKISGDLLRQVLLDRNFSNIIGNYFSFEVESILYEELGFNYEMGDQSLAILVQAINTFVIEYKGQVIPLPKRCMTYKINPRLNSETTAELKDFIHKLAVGV